MKTTMPPIITLDGPAGSGKGTLARRIATHLGYHLLDSGALYRLTAIGAQHKNIALNDEAALAHVAHHLQVRFTQTASGEECILLDGADVTAQVRAETTGELASQIAVLPAVRAALVALQHSFAQAPGLVADGRDMGTVIFPHAPHKFFITASAAARAQRRYKQLQGLGVTANLAQLEADIAERDHRDINRAAAPLKPADDAVLVDTSEMSIDEVVTLILSHL